MTYTADTGALRFGRPLEVKTRGDAWTVEGFCSAYTLDLGGDVIAPGAYRQTLADGHKIRFLYGHDQAKVLGVPLELTEDLTTGLYGKFRISQTPLGAEVRQLLLDGALDAFSVGYVPRDSEIDPATGVRQLNEIELVEVSIVSIPMQPAAVVTSAKTGGGLVAQWRARRAALRPAHVHEATRRYGEMVERDLRLAALAAAKHRARVQGVAV